MMARRDRLLLAALTAWAFTPIAVLIVRAMAQSWRFPQILPDLADVRPALSAAANGRVTSAMIASLALAFASGSIGTILGFAIARSAVRVGGQFQQLTLAAAFFTVVAPPIALGVGLQVAVLGIGLGGTFTGVFFAHLVPVTGYLTLFAVGVFASFDGSLEDEARTLGASRWQVLWRIVVPLLRRRLGEGLILGGLVSWGQLALTLLVGGGLVRTLPVELLSIVQSGNDQAGAFAALILSVPPMFAIGLLTVGAKRTGASL
jgi:putative spermidine/putrescine transport system permease protein